MPLPKINLLPHFNISRLSHIELSVKDLSASHAFYVDTFGLQVTDQDDNFIYLRGMEERGHHCVILKKSATSTCNVLGYKVFDEEQLEKAEFYFKSKNIPAEWIERPYQGRTLLTKDVQGIPIEFYYKMERLPAIHQKYKLYTGVKPLRIDHFNVFSTNVDESVKFYSDIGFRVTEYTEDEKSKKLWAAWMQRKGTVHDVAFTNGVGPRLHHVAFWVPSPLNIIDLLDVMSTTGYISNIERGPGRHGISNAFFLYIRDPDGHRIEIYCSDYQTLDTDHEPIKWDLKDPQRQTLWGAPAPKSWFEEGSKFLNVDPKEPSLKAQPIVAP
tara:strand:- start:2219 stop:3199 length:981 start_codon:yes stop_codon:yes gene_type:complete